MVVGSIPASLTYALELRDLSINYRYFHASNRMAEIPGLKAKEGLTLNMDVGLGGCFYWNNKIKSLTNDGGYVWLAWNFYLGCEVIRRRLYLEYEHESSHLLDRSDQSYWMGKHPVRDSAGLIWRLYP